MSSLIGAVEPGGFWLPERASTAGAATDGLFHFILWLCVFFAVLIFALLVVFVVKYRHRPGERKDSHAGHSLTLELTWTIIPTLLTVVIYYYGFRGYLNLSVEPPNAYEITATGQMWKWTFTYPNGHQDEELHVPAGMPVRVVLASQDVIHSLSIPDLRVKKDVVPGRYNRIWFEAEKKPGAQPDEHQVYCAAYCGTQHSAMLTHAYVHEPADFKQWLIDATARDMNMPPVELGAKLHKTKGCATCHTVDGSPSTGPTWSNMFGSTVPLADGSTVLADEAYVRESVYQPQAKVHQGFGPPSQMPSFQGLVNERELGGLIAYMKSISTNSASAAAPTTGPAGEPPPDVVIPPRGKRKKKPDAPAAETPAAPAATPAESPAAPSTTAPTTQAETPGAATGAAPAASPATPVTPGGTPPAPPASPESRPAEAQPGAETKAPETKPAETKPAEASPTDAKPAEAKADAKDSKEGDAKPADSPATKPGEAAAGEKKSE